MTIAARPAAGAPAAARVALVALCAVAGSAALWLRPVAHVALVSTVLVGLAGVVAPLPTRERERAPRGERRAIGRALAVTTAGCASFAAVRLLAPVGTPLGVAGIATVVLAAIAEEAFFRRFLYAWLARASTLAAVVVPAALFAAVHVPTYGAVVLPIDLAAGLLLGWQRWASGTWLVPAATHVVANLLQMG